MRRRGTPTGTPQYSVEVRERLLERMAAGENVMDLVEETGIAQTTLYRWWSNGNKISAMSPSDKADGRFTSKEKLKIVQTAGTLTETELGAYLRRQGVSEQQLKRWQTEMEAALERPKRRRQTNVERELRQENKRLKRELRRKERALAEAAALLVLKKKAEAIWGDGDESTDERTD